MTFINALAQAAAEPASKPSQWSPFIMMALIFLAFWFLIIAPNNKKQKEHRKMLEALKPGDEVITSGGIFGTIQQVRKDRLIVKISDDTRIEVAKGFVTSKVSKDETEAKASK